MAGEGEGNTRRRGRLPPPTTPEALEHAAGAYLTRFAASTERLRQVLLRQVERSAAARGEEPEAGRALVEALIARFVRSGLLDDRRFAEGRADALHRRGLAAQAIRHRLRADGVSEDAIDAALAALSAARQDSAVPLDLAAAVHLARRRRLGPFRVPADRRARRTRDLAALSRAGFDPDTARAVIDAESPEELEEQVGLRP